ncbi:response regulator [Paenibacillus qinlingensis]|uniref:Two-component system response regulator YesN n=1 Tax=Paenibacillus qinlingensis TaxID=1837343 RepID=A0ABU1P1P4_9BACL|nr:response regulator [Paenibacillus qinlingensis]MDR6553668.1 two-component system response regulator YesN [Paenibacillus qinlingensis]
MREVTCLIVDDEPPMVKRLETYFERWAERRMPFRLVGRAYSGAEALERADELRPDLIITDIVMPGMDGIELVRQLRERLPGVEVIILSAYSDFAYAKQAIAMGVFEYLVKVPLREEDVHTALSKARDNVIAREEKERRLQSLSGSVKENSYRLRKHLFEELLRGEVSDSVMDRRSAELVPSFEPRQYGCFALRFDNYDVFCSEYSPADRNMLKYGMLNIIEEVLREKGSCFACELQQGVIVALAAIQAGSEQSFDRNCYELGESIRDAIKTYLRISVSIGVSRMYNGWGQAAKAYEEAKGALADTFYASFGSVVTPNRRLAYTESDWRELSERFEHTLERSSSKSGGEVIVPLLHVLHSHRVIPGKLLGYVDGWYARLRQRLLSTANGDAAEVVTFADCTHLHQLVDQLRIEWERLHAQVEGSGLRAEMVKAMRFVEDHLKESISLSVVAEHIHLNPSYVSELFKKELGINFTDYVSKRRIERAIELLRKRDYSNLELAEAVGVHNEKYFCTLFKKITGTSPQKFVAASGRD